MNLTKSRENLYMLQAGGWSSLSSGALSYPHFGLRFLL